MKKKFTKKVLSIALIFMTVFTSMFMPGTPLNTVETAYADGTGSAYVEWVGPSTFSITFNSGPLAGQTRTGRCQHSQMPGWAGTHSYSYTTSIINGGKTRLHEVWIRDGSDGVGTYVIISPNSWTAGQLSQTLMSSLWNWVEYRGQYRSYFEKQMALVDGSNYTYDDLWIDLQAWLSSHGIQGNPQYIEDQLSIYFINDDLSRAKGQGVYASWEEPLTGDVTVVKTAESGNAAYINAFSLGGAVFELINSSGVSEGTRTTRADGTLATPWSVLPGTYTIREVTAPHGYDKATDRSVTVVVQGKHTVNVPEKENHGQLQINKIASTASAKYQLRHPLEGAVFRATHSDGTTTYTFTTKRDGTTDPQWVKAGSYTITEVSAPEGYDIAIANLNNVTVEILKKTTESMDDYANIGLFQIDKTPGSTLKTPSGKDYDDIWPLKGTQYQVLRPDGSVVTGMKVVNDNGDYTGATVDVLTVGDKVGGKWLTETVELKCLPQGQTYTYREVAASVQPGWRIDSNHNATIKADEKVVGPSSEKPDYGYFNIRKVYARDCDLALENEHQYTTLGAKFEIYNADTNQKVELIPVEDTTVPVSGKARLTSITSEFESSDRKYSDTQYVWLPEGRYYIMEPEVPNGMDKNPNKVYFNVTADEANTWEFENTPHLDPIQIALKKHRASDSDLNLATAGTKFTVYFLKQDYADISEVPLDSNGVPENPEKIFKFITKINDSPEYKRENPDTWRFDSFIRWEDSYLDEGSDPLYKDDDGEPVALIGTYYFVETQATDGLATVEPFIRTIFQGGQVGEYDAWVMVDGLTTSDDNQTIKVKLQKVDSETKEPAVYTDKYDATFEGAKYALYEYYPYNAAGRRQVMNPDRTDGYYVTDANGTFEITRLQPNTYWIEEVEAPKGYVTDKVSHEIKAVVGESNTAVFDYGTITSEEDHTWVKVYKTTIDEEGNTVPLGDALLTLYNSAGEKKDEWTTTEEGYEMKAVAEGIWKVKEPNIPAGYLPLVSVDAAGNYHVGDYVMDVQKISELQEFTIFNEPIPTLKTTAIFSNGVKESKADADVSVIDKVEYKKVLKGHPYTLKAELVDFETGDVVGTGYTYFVPDSSSGTIDVNLGDVNLTTGSKLVVYETLYRNDRVSEEDPDARNGVVNEDNKVAEHKDLTDTDQTVYVPSVQTSAYDIIDDGKDLFAKGEQTIVDIVTYENVAPNVEHTVKGTLMVKSTGEPLKDKSGKEITAEKTFTPTSESGSVTLEFTFDASLLAGETVVVFERLYIDKIEVAAHADINDPKQSVDIPKIGTSLKTQDGHADIDIDSDEITLVDTVSYENLIVGKEYVMKGTLVNKSTGEPIKAAGKEVTGEAVFTPENASGAVEIEFKFPGSAVTESIVAFETLEVKATGKPVAEHKDLNDEGQTILVPEVKTTAFDKIDEGKELFAGENQTIVDIVELKNLIIDETYTVKGVIMDKDTEEPLLDKDGNEIRAEKTFKATQEDMKVEVAFNLNADTLDGKRTVAFENLYRMVSDVERHVGKHEDIDDENQEVDIVELRTTATDAIDQEHDLLAGEAKVIDRVYYKGLTVGKEYTVSGVLYDKETGEPILAGGKEITSKATFKAESKDGYIDITFKFDASLLAGKTIVAFEEMRTTKKVVGVHADLDDEEQTIYIPEIKTTAIDKEDGDKNLVSVGPVTVVDTVEYKNLIPGREYTMEGVLMVKSTGAPLKDKSGKEITSTKTFIPEDKNGLVELEFTFDGSLAESEILVAFETLISATGKPVAEHKDIDDEDQTVYVPGLRTTVDKKSVVGKDKTVVIDTVSYKNLIEGETYTVKGILMDKKTGKPVKVNGKEVTAETEFTAKSRDGKVEVKFSFDATSLKGKDLVVFETLYWTDADGNEKKIAAHEDINDAAQTFTVKSPAPETGDNSNIIMHLGIGISSLLAVILLAVKRKKTN